MSRRKNDDIVVRYASRGYTEDQLLRNRISSRLNKWMNQQIMLGMRDEHPETYESLYKTHKTKITEDAELEYQAAIATRDATSHD